MMLNNNLSHFWGSIYEKKFFYPNLSTAKGQLLNQKIKIMKKYLLFIGIDISKKWIDLAASFDGKEKQMHHKRFTNDVKGFDAMLKWLSQLFNVDLQSGALFCMEHTGVYTIPLCAYLEG